MQGLEKLYAKAVQNSDAAKARMDRLERRATADVCVEGSVHNSEPAVTGILSEDPPQGALHSAESAAADEVVVVDAAAEPIPAYQSLYNTAKRRLESATEALEGGRVAVATAVANRDSPFVQHQLYWLKGFTPTVDNITYANAANVSYMGALYVYGNAESAASEEPLDIPEEYAHLRTSIGASVWSSPLRELVTLEVLCGATDAPFAPSVTPSSDEGATGTIQPPLGAAELAKALDVLRSCATSFSNQGKHMTTYALAPCVVDMSYYNLLADSVAPEQMSVPVLMHCMLEQCVHLCVDSTAEVERQESELAEAAAAFDAAFQQPDKTRIAPEPPRVVVGGKYEYTAVLEGDRVGMAAHGLFSGIVTPRLRGKLRSPPLPSRTIAHADAQNVACADGTAVSRKALVDVEAVESHMIALLMVPGFMRSGMPATRTQAAVDAAIERDMLHALAHEVRPVSSASFLKVESNVFLDTLIQKMFFLDNENK